MKRIAIVLLIWCIFPTALLWGQDFGHVSSSLFSDHLQSVIKFSNYLYCGGRDGLPVFNIADPANPVSAHYFDFPNIGKMVSQGTYAFAIDSHYGHRFYGLRIIDLSDSLRPVLVGFYGTGSDELKDIAIKGNTVFLAENAESGFDSHLEIVDVSDPAVPSAMASLEVPPLIVSMFIDSVYAYIAYSYDFNPNGFVIVDVSDPQHPSLLSDTDLGMYYSPVDIAALGNYAYLLSAEILIFDVSDHMNPELINIYDLSGYRLHINENIAYLFSVDGIHILDLSNPIYPELLGLFTNEYGLSDQYFSGDTVYTVRPGYFPSYAPAIYIIDLSDPGNPTSLGNSFLCDEVEDVQLFNNHAFIANGYSGLQVVDITDPYYPQVGYRAEVYDRATDIFTYDHYAWIIDSLHSLITYDISNPEMPIEISAYNGVEVIFHYVYVEGSYAYVIARMRTDPFNRFLLILDISDPSSPSFVNSYEDLYQPLFIHVADDYAYISCPTSLEIIDITDPYSPIQRGTYGYRDHGMRLFVDGNYAYVAALANGIEIIDISDPFNPTMVGSYDSIYVSAVSVQDGYAYLSGYSGIHLLDITEPYDPSFIASYEEAGAYAEVIADGEYIYVAAENRFLILRLTPTGLEEVRSINLSTFSLSPNYPNPFNAATTIEYSLPEEAAVTIEIYDILGRRIETLVAGKQPAGSHAVVWEAKNTPSGVYFYRIEAGEYSQTEKCVLLK